jgi:hypothetical protein
MRCHRACGAHFCWLCNELYELNDVNQHYIDTDPYGACRGQPYIPQSVVDAGVAVAGGGVAGGAIADGGVAGGAVADGGVVGGVVVDGAVADGAVAYELSYNDAIVILNLLLEDGGRMEPGNMIDQLQRQIAIVEGRIP